MEKLYLITLYNLIKPIKHSNIYLWGSQYKLKNQESFKY